MGSFVLVNASVVINSVDLSDHVTSVTLLTARDDIENTSMGLNYKSHLAGLGQFTLDVEFNQDYDVAKIDDTLWPIYSAASPVPVVIKPVNDVVSATNPSFSGNVLL